MSRHGQRCGQRIGVATPPGGCDLEWLEWCRDTKLMSRHGLASRRSRPGNDVATWPGAGQGQGGRDMRPRHGSYARNLRTLSARPALAMRAT